MGIHKAKERPTIGAEILHLHCIWQLIACSDRLSPGLIENTRLIFVSILCTPRPQTAPRKSYSSNQNFYHLFTAKSYLLRSLVGFLHFEGHPLKDASGYDLREAKLGLDFALFFIQKLGISDVLVMSSFKAQVAMMTRLMTREYRDHLVKPRIQTIDVSQGSEADAVNVLMTRNNGSPGFLRSITVGELM